jgi:hypothetical protein
VNWLRGRQEIGELNFWLTVVSYDPNDESFSNRLYLVYLVLFFSVWIFVTLTFFASGSAMLLPLLNAQYPGKAAVVLMGSILAIWNMVRLYNALKRSPVEFSDEDSYLLCQTPVSRRAVVLRWFWMPWFKSAFPFWLLAMLLGYSLGDIAFSDTIITSHFVEYLGYGLRAWLTLAPVHLALFALQWVIGVMRVRANARVRYSTALALISGLALPVVLWLALPWFEKAGYVVIVAAGIGAAILSLAALVMTAKRFNLSRAAQETRRHVLLNDALRYGQSNYAENLRAEQHLRKEKAPTRLPGRPGPAALIWKDLLQVMRGLRLSKLQRWFSLASTAFGIFVMPGSISSLLLFIWVIQVGKIAITRLRSDLSCWPIFHQLPISNRRAVMLDMASALVGIVAVSLLAGLGGWAVRNALLNTEAGSLLMAQAGESVGIISSVTFLLIPGTAVAVAGMAALDVVRHAQSNLLLIGQAPDVDFLGLISGLAAAGLPVFIMAVRPGLAGSLLGFGSSLLMGAIAMFLAGRARPA